jgi:hypothetical protein
MDKEKIEKLLAEAVRGYMSSDDAMLGLSYHDKKPGKLDDKESSHFQWHQWEYIDDSFSEKVVDSPFFESLCAAFFKIHSYKYLDDGSFPLALESELRSMGVPQIECVKAYKAIKEIVEEHKGNSDCWTVYTEYSKGWGERDAGWNPAMDEIADMTRNADQREPKADDPFTGGGPAPKDISEDSKKN